MPSRTESAISLVDGTWQVPGNDRLDLPGFHMLDGPRGVSAFSGLRATAFPVAMMRGATWDPALEARVGRAMALETRAAGADTILAPTINILRHPRWGRAQETYSEDVHHLGELAVSFIRGVQDAGVLATSGDRNAVDDAPDQLRGGLERRRGAVPEVAKVVPPPAPGSTVGAYRARMAMARRH